MLVPVRLLMSSSSVVNFHLLLLSIRRALISYVERATRQIASVATSSKIVVEKSTVPCRTAESMRTILEANSKPNCRFDILSNPEFLAEGTAVADLYKPDRVLIGSLQTPEGKAACDALSEVYANWVPLVSFMSPLIRSANIPFPPTAQTVSSPSVSGPPNSPSSPRTLC